MLKTTIDYLLRLAPENRFVYFRLLAMLTRTSRYCNEKRKKLLLVRVVNEEFSTCRFRDMAVMYKKKIEKKQQKFIQIRSF